MSDPYWYEILPSWAQDVIDQLGHVLLAGAPAGISGYVSSIWLSDGWSGLIAAIVGSSVMVTYEIIQNYGDYNNSYLDMAIDLSVGISTAILVGTAFWLIK